MKLGEKRGGRGGVGQWEGGWSGRGRGGDRLRLTSAAEGSDSHRHANLVGGHGRAVDAGAGVGAGAGASSGGVGANVGALRGRVSGGERGGGGAAGAVQRNGERREPTRRAVAADWPLTDNAISRSIPTRRCQPTALATSPRH